MATFFDRERHRPARQSGCVLSASLPRWGHPAGAFHYVPFGGVFEEERTFDGVTITTRVRVGWHIDAERFEAEGEFFRAVADSAPFR